MKNYFHLFIMISLCFYACKNTPKENMIKVNELLSQLDSTETKFNEIDSASVFSNYLKMESDLSYLHQLVDTIDQNTFELIESMRDTRTKLTFVYNNYQLFLIEVKKSKSQLANLKVDLINNLIKDGEFINHYNMEKNIILNLNQVFDSSFANTKAIIDETTNQIAKLDSILSHQILVKNASSING